MTSAPEVILLVEADLAVRSPLAQYLRECGFVVREVAHGDEAREALALPDLAIDLVIADLNTPGSGFGFSQWLRRKHPAVDLMLASSVESAVEKAAEVCLEGPALVKPYEHKMVLARIRRMLADRRRS
jgi:DNA-binding response OmpR family regulator